MQIYHFDELSGVLLGVGTAELSPLEPDIHLVPANATTVEPPDAPEGQQAVWDLSESRSGWLLQSLTAQQTAAPPRASGAFTPAPDGFTDASMKREEVLEPASTEPDMPRTIPVQFPPIRAKISTDVLPSDTETFFASLIPAVVEGE